MQPCKGAQRQWCEPASLKVSELFLPPGQLIPLSLPGDSDEGEVQCVPLWYLNLEFCACSLLRRSIQRPWLVLLPWQLPCPQDCLPLLPAPPLCYRTSWAIRTLRTSWQMWGGRTRWKGKALSTPSVPLSDHVMPLVNGQGGHTAEQRGCIPSHNVTVTNVNSGTLAG